MAEEAITLYIENGSEIGESIILDETAASQLLSGNTTEIVVEIDESCVHSDGNYIYRVKRIVQGEEKEVMCVDLEEDQKDVDSLQDVKDNQTDVIGSDSVYRNETILDNPKDLKILVNENKKEDCVNNHHEICEQIINKSNTQLIHEPNENKKEDCVNNHHEICEQIINKSSTQLIHKPNEDKKEDCVNNHHEICEQIFNKSNTQLIHEPDLNYVVDSVSVSTQEIESETVCNTEGEDRKNFIASSIEEREDNVEPSSCEDKNIKKHVSDPNFPFSCSQCDKSFRKQLSLRVHELSHVTEEAASAKIGKFNCKYSCPVCDFRCKSKKSMQLHMADDHCLYQFFTCYKCKFIAISPENYTKHMQSTLHSECESSFKVKSETQARPFLCSQCGFSTVNFQRLERHMLVHSDEKGFACPHCQYRGKTKYCLKKHLEIHDKNLQYLCSLCAYSTHNVYALQRHTQHKHVATPRYKCRKCDSAFSLMSQLRIHAMMEHKFTDSFFCVCCSFTCRDRLTLRQHMQFHRGQNMLSCDECSYTCRSASRLQSHKLRHTGIKPYTCSQCPQSFYELSGLRRHAKNHSDDKPFSCSLCDYKCKFQNILTLHMKVHINVKNYTCDLCDYSTKYLGNLKKHKLIHDEVKHFPCNFCGYTARLREALKRHLIRVHKCNDLKVR